MFHKLLLNFTGVRKVARATIFSRRLSGLDNISVFDRAACHRRRITNPWHLLDGRFLPDHADHRLELAKENRSTKIQPSSLSIFCALPIRSVTWGEKGTAFGMKRMAFSTTPSTAGRQVVHSKFAPWWAIASVCGGHY
jgi:hypothetical protein